MSGCHVIKGNDEPCGNYALKGKTCCWVHRKLENEPYSDEKPPKPEKKEVSDEYRCVKICRNGKRCSRFYNFSKDKVKMCGQHFRMGMDNLFIEGIKKQQKESESESESDSDSDNNRDPSYYARIKKK
jgi:hypothetical protein